MPRFLALAAAFVVFGCTAHAQVRSDAPARMIPIGDISAASLLPAQEKFEELAEKGETNIWLQIDSFGGSVFDGMDFIKAIEQSKKTHPGLVVTCVVDSKAMSMGAATLESDVCDKRLMTKRSVILFHNASVQGRGTAKDLHDTAEQLEALDKALTEMIVDRLNPTAEEYAHKVEGKDWMMSHAEALDVGAIDGTIKPSELPPLYVLESATPLFFLF